ncbi:MAG: glutathione S-transferase family protein, partial [Chromatiales bacterium]|nr:glutathione S-transferase family protein [Chromatiales bacterium]
TIVHDDIVVTESSIILEYLEDTFPDVPLRPATPVGRALMRSWIRVPDDGLHIACGTVSYAAAFADQAIAYHGRASLDAKLARLPDRTRALRQSELLEKRFDASFMSDHVKLYDKALGDVEAALTDGRDWLAGDTFSLAECAVLPYIWRLDRLNLDAMWSERPNLTAWFARAIARPSWQRAIESYPPRGAHDYDDDARPKGLSFWPVVAPMLGRVAL